MTLTYVSRRLYWLFNVLLSIIARTLQYGIMNKSTRLSTLKVLSNIIAKGIDAIESGCDAQGHSYPTLDDPYDLESNTVQNKYTAEAAPVIAAAYQLIATLSNPDPYLFTWGLTVCFLNYPDIVKHMKVLRFYASHSSARQSLSQAKAAFPIFYGRPDLG